MTEKQNISTSNLGILYSSTDIQRCITGLAQKISADYQEQGVHDICAICVMNGAMHFFCHLTEQICGITVDERCISASSYGNDLTSSGHVTLNIPFPLEAIKGKHVLIVEDVIDSGRTIARMLEYFQKEVCNYEPASIRICTLLDKTSRRVVENLQIDYSGFQITEDIFLVGFGLDYMQMYRNLDYIGYIS